MVEEFTLTRFELMVQAQEKIDAELKKLSRLDGNKTCVDCPEKVPLMMTFNDAILSPI